MEKIEDINGQLLADLRNKLSPILNLCEMIKNGDNPVYNNPKLNELLMSEVEKTIKVVNFISKKNHPLPIPEEQEDMTDFDYVIEMVRSQLTPDEQENNMDYTDCQQHKDAVWYKGHLGIPGDVAWSKGSYVLNGKTNIYYIIDDNGLWVGESKNGKFDYRVF